jgi:sugar O-acyltransferase (sialic acid O-acetyltransferase NeuD family)
MSISFGLLGNGGQADEAEDFARPDRVVFRAVSSEYLETGREDLVDILNVDPAYFELPVVAAVGAPGARRRMVQSWAGSRYHSIVANSASLSSSASMGVGAIVAPQSAISAGVTLGDHVLVNIGASVSHDSVVGDYVTISPGVRIAGKCHIGDGVFLGIGAVVSNGISIASGTVIAAGAVVINDIVSPGVYVGVPARRLRDQEGWLSAI